VSCQNIGTKFDVRKKTTITGLPSTLKCLVIFGNYDGAHTSDRQTELMQHTSTKLASNAACNKNSKSNKSKCKHRSLFLCIINAG